MPLHIVEIALVGGLGIPGYSRVGCANVATCGADILEGAFGDTALENLMVMSSFVGTFLLSFCVVFALAIAEHTYFQVIVAATASPGGHFLFLL
jgi:hypothetical protein